MNIATIKARQLARALAGENEEGEADMSRDLK